MECSPPGFSVHRISQARILEWVATSFSCGSSQPSNWTSASCIGMWIVYCWATRKALSFPPLSRFPVSHSMLAVSGFATWVYYLWSNGHLHSLIQDTFAYWWKKPTGHLIPRPPLPKSLHQYKKRMGFLAVQQKDRPHPFSTTTKLLLEAKQNKTFLNFLL